MSKLVPPYLRLLAVLVAAAAALPALAADAAPPTNDTFLGAFPVTQPLPYTNTQDTTESTLELPIEPQNCSLTSHSVWYSFTPNQDGTVKITTFGSGYDTTVSVYTGPDLANLALVGCNDDTGSGLQSAINFPVQKNTTYRIQVGSVELLSAGTLTIDVFWGTPPVNDNRNNALIASPSYTNSQDTTVATMEAGEPDSCGGAVIGRTVWYRYTPAQTGNVTISTFGSDFDTILAVYTIPVVDLVQLICNDDSGPPTSEVQFVAQAGVTHWIQAGGFWGSSGSLTVSVSQAVSATATPTPSPTATATPSPTPTRTATPTPTRTPTWANA